jgi:hypothetical protein
MTEFVDPFESARPSTTHCAVIEVVAAVVEFPVWQFTTCPPLVVVDTPAYAVTNAPAGIDSAQYTLLTPNILIVPFSLVEST